MQVKWLDNFQTHGAITLSHRSLQVPASLNMCLAAEAVIILNHKLKGELID